MADTAVEYNFLSGNCGLKVANLCLGCALFGDSKLPRFNPDGLVKADEAFKIIDCYVAMGGNFLDTANNYTSGHSEEIIGEWLQKNNSKREEMVIATKVRMPPKDLSPRHPNDHGLSRKHILLNVEESLKRLQTDYIDLYQTHMWDSGVPLEETVSTLNDLVRAGKVRYVGASNVTGWQLQKTVDLCKYMGFAQYVSLQQEYNLLDRLSEYEPFEVCRNEGLGVLPWSPLKGGLLTGKYKRGMAAAPPGTRVAWFSDKKMPSAEFSVNFSDIETNEDYWRIRDLLDKLAEKQKKSVAQVALRWLLQKEPVTSVIIGVRSLANLEDNMGAGKGWSLSDEDMKQLDDVSANITKYPYIIYKANSDRLRKGCPHGRQY